MNETVLAYNFFLLFCVLTESHEKSTMAKIHAISMNFPDVFAIYLYFQCKNVKQDFFARKWRAVILG